MIGGRTAGPSPAELGALMRLVEFALAVNKDPEKIRQAIDEVATAKEETLAILTRQANELAEQKRALAARDEEVSQQTLRNESTAKQLDERRAQIESDEKSLAASISASEGAALTRSARLDAREAEIAKGEERLAADQAALDARNRAEAQANIAAMAKVKQAQAAVEEQKDALERAKADVTAIRVDYESKLAALRAAVGS